MKRPLNIPDKLIEGFISSCQEDLIQKYNLTRGKQTENEKWRAKLRLLILGDFIDASNQEKFKLMLLEYENLVLQYMEYKLSKESKRDNTDILNFVKELNSNYKINGVRDFDKVGQWQLLNSLFIPTNHPDFKVWVDKMKPSYKSDFFDSMGEVVTTLSSNFEGDFQKGLTQIMGALYINQKMKLMVRTEEEKLKFEEIEDKVHSNLEKFLLNTEKIANASSDNWQEDILDLLEYVNEDFKEDHRLIKKIGAIRERLGKKSKEGCYIATACYGSYSSPEVLILRGYRDNILSQNFFGRKVIKIYYKISPRLAEKLIDYKKLNRFVKSVLDFIVKRIGKNEIQHNVKRS